MEVLDPRQLFFKQSVLEQHKNKHNLRLNEHIIPKINIVNTYQPQQIPVNI